MSDIIIRPAIKNDAAFIAKLLMQASGGIIEFLLTDVMPNVSPEQIMQHEAESDEARCSYRFVTIAELENKPVGILHCYSSELYLETNDSHNDPAFLERMNYLLPMQHNFPDNALYVNAIAVLPNYQNKGIGKKLLDYAKCIAKNKKQAVIGHAWADNNRAIELYEREGFKIIEHIDIKRRPHLLHDGGMVLMRFKN
ncbi:MAG: N-acetyltransferase [Gammaproteobacteria bacterium]|nr:N-acetyltransferase [Gammaproteobacteria bacterium]